MTIIYGTKYPGTKKYEDRHGKVRWYLRGPPDNPLPDPYDVGKRKFDAAYREAIGLAGAGQRPAPKPPTLSPGNTIEKVVRDFLNSPGSMTKAEATQNNLRKILVAWAKDVGSLSIGTLKTRDIEQGLQNRSTTPPSANQWLTAVRLLCQYAIAEKRYGITVDPTAGVRRLLVPPTKGFAEWTEADVPKFIARWPKGTMEYRALMVLLWAGQRRTDVVTFGWDKVEGNMIGFEQHKTKKKMRLPIPASLLDVLPPRDNVVHLDGKPAPFLLASKGGRFTPSHFTRWFHKACVLADLPHLSTHGTRKLASQRMYRALLRAGKPNALSYVMAFTGHETEKQLRVYLGRGFEQQELAEELVTFMEPGKMSNLAFAAGTVRQKSSKERVV
jgi:integrase